MTVLGIGTATGLVFALPVKTGSVACPPAGEGRVNCLLQHAWAPAFVKLAAAILVTWLVTDLLKRVPELRYRWRSGERLARRSHDHGREAVLSDSVLNAATWGIVPEAKPAWRVVRPEPNRALAAAFRAPVVTAEERVVAPAPVEVPVAALPGVRAVLPAERFRRATEIARHVRVLSAEDLRGRKLRRGSDPALVVSCWSDASSARDLPDRVHVPV
jgi:hypothetical protein